MNRMFASPPPNPGLHLFPWNPFPETLGFAMTEGARSSLAGSMPMLFAGTKPDPLFISIKGRITESVMTSSAIRELLADTGGWHPISPRLAPQGIDGLFIKVDGQGRPHGLLVAEAKFGSSQLGQTLSGRQMSSPWVQLRLHRLASDYSRFADHLRQPCRFMTQMPKDVRGLAVPLQGNRTATIWIDDNGMPTVYCRHPATGSEVQYQLRLVGHHLEAGAKGEIPYRARLFRLSTNGKQFVMESKPLDSAGHLIGGPENDGRVIRGPFSELTPRVQHSLVRVLEHEFKAQGYGPNEARQMARRASQDPEYLQNMRRQAVWSWRAGLDWRISVAGGVAMLVASAFELIAVGMNRSDSWERAGTRVLLAGVSGIAGHLAAAQFQALLVGTEIGRNILHCLPETIAGHSSANFLGSSAGGAVASIVFLIGFRFMGWTDNRELGRGMVSSIGGVTAGALASAATMATVMTFGTASTGTAIASLSGAAATNAALASLGGGSLAVGGGGMALGSAVLTGGAALVVVGTGIALKLAFKKLDDIHQRRLIAGRLEVVKALTMIA